MGMNPGVVNHFISHGLRMATGIADPRAAAKAFGLKAIVFSERDNQRPARGTKAAKQVDDSFLEVIHNTWSPVNYSVETAECKLLWPGMPTEAKETVACDVALVAWCPAGPIVGFCPPHDECLTCQVWFDQTIPALFIYEAPDSARLFLKGPGFHDSASLPSVLLQPGAHELQWDSYDMLGVVLLSSLPGRDPMWCGVNMKVSDAALQDPSLETGPTTLEVMGGIWAGLKYIVTHPDAGDHFSEDLPTDFVLGHAFPFAGRLMTRPGKRWRLLPSPLPVS